MIDITEHNDDLVGYKVLGEPGPSPKYATPLRFGELISFFNTPEATAQSIYDSFQNQYKQLRDFQDSALEKAVVHDDLAYHALYRESLLNAMNILEKHYGSKKT